MPSRSNDTSARQFWGRLDRAQECFQEGPSSVSTTSSGHRSKIKVRNIGNKSKFITKTTWAVPNVVLAYSFKKPMLPDP